MTPLDALMKRYDEKNPRADGFARGFYRFEAIKVLGELNAVGCTITVPARLMDAPDDSF